MPRPKLLLVDDDAEILRILTDSLRDRYSIVLAADARAALYQLETEHPNLILLDLRLPDMSGVLLINKIRQTSKVPIIVLSGWNDQLSVVQSLRNGADDFIAKPFDLDNLDTRIEVVLKRASREPISASKERSYGGLVISPARGALYNGRPFHLTPTEHKLLTEMVSNGGEVVTYASLAEVVWGHGHSYDGSDMTHAMHVYVARLRRLLDSIDGAPKIHTVTRTGYRLTQ